MNFAGGSKCTSKTKHIEDQQIQFGAQNRFVPICEINPFIDVNLLKSNVRGRRSTRGRRNSNSARFSASTFEQPIETSEMLTVSTRSRGRSRGRPRGRGRSRNMSMRQTPREVEDMLPIVLDSDSDTETLRRNEDLLASSILQTL